MRLKLVLLTSLVAAILNAGAAIAILLGTYGAPGLTPAHLGFRSGSWVTILIFIPPLLSAILAAIFVYRHTARRRKLQAALSGVLALVLWLIAIGIATLIR
jgi:chromate transport protein ChrA